MPAKKEVDGSTYQGRFALRMVTLRTKAGLSSKEVADLLGVHWRTVYRWEDGTRDPSIEQLPAIAKVLGVSIRTLFPEK